MKTDISLKLKKKVLEEFNIKILKEFNLSIEILRQIFDEEEVGTFDEAVDSCWELDGAEELRRFLDSLLKILRSSESKNSGKPHINNIKPVHFSEYYRSFRSKKKKENKKQLKLKL